MAGVTVGLVSPPFFLHLIPLRFLIPNCPGIPVAIQVIGGECDHKSRRIDEINSDKAPNEASGLANHWLGKERKARKNECTMGIFLTSPGTMTATG